jgi:hypothetical protein
MNPRVSPDFFRPEPWPRTFKEAYCDYFRCRPDRFEKSLFRRGLNPHARPLALLIRWFAPDYFREDLALIRELGEIKNPSLFNYELNVFKGRIQRENKWLKRTCLIRVSGRRLARIRTRIFGVPRSK